ncbi:MAG: OmpA family protein [Saprospiraceae bacterium]|nr:OmpA family protein [Saprospiraceae bacterium]
MTHVLRQSLILFGMFLATIACTQTPLHPDGIGARFLLLDHYTPNIYDNAEPQKISNGIEINYHRNVGWKYLNIVLPLKLGVAKLPGAQQDIRFTSLDLLLQGSFFDADKLASPYFFAGGGLVLEDYAESNIQFPLGIGLNIKLSRDFYLNAQGEFRKSMASGKDNLQYGIGFLYVPGLKKIVKPVDSDQDGILDPDDRCPALPGLPEFKGCPDTDKDGIPDPEDLCPAEAGTILAKGCPDMDNDGVADAEDECPELPGPPALSGCPDTDGDGLTDQVDQCPEQSGLATNGGCPDRDDDGIIDSNDACPDEPGLAEDNGCPVSEDSDGDGIPDNRDKCPQTPGPVQGCPDRDGDSIADRDDACPDIPGLPNLNGCPPPQDSDGDGIQDDQDACPSVAGLPELKGCPPEGDQDGDGFPDSKDECPTLAGKLNGCPDRDGDGVADPKDRCPDRAGPATNEGCPIISAEDRSALDLAMRNVQFETGSATILPESYLTLDRVAEVLLRYPDYHLIINGHTDNVGRPATNLALSEQRARACYNYLISRGVVAKRMLPSGFGQTRPITSNKSEEGKRMNRRVEFIMYLK